MLTIRPKTPDVGCERGQSLSPTKPCLVTSDRQSDLTVLLGDSLNVVYLPGAPKERLLLALFLGLQRLGQLYLLEEWVWSASALILWFLFVPSTLLAQY